MVTHVMKHDLARKIEHSKADYIESWLQGMQEQPGNPFEVHIERFGSARAFLASNLAEIGIFNRVIGLSPKDMVLLDDIIDFYHDHGIIGYRIGINPYYSTPEFLAHLAKRGLYQSLFQTNLFCLPTLDLPSHPSNVEVRQIGSNEADIFANLYVEGFRQELSRVPETTLKRLGESTKVLYEQLGWRLYIVSVDDVPGGVGLLYIQDSIASLAGGATAPAFRNQGCQTATIRQRILAAAQAGCSLVVGQSGIGTVSQHNMERVGMNVAYTRVIWTERVS